jgi:hypothetical protein
MSLNAKANANGSITVWCGADAVNIEIVNGRLVISAAAPIPLLTRAQPVEQSATPTSPSPRPKPVIIPGPPATGPRTMIRVPGFDEDVNTLTIGIGKAVCFDVKHDEWVAPRDVWERLSAVASPKSLHFYFPTKVKR